MPLISQKMKLFSCNEALFVLHFFLSFSYSDHNCLLFPFLDTVTFSTLHDFLFSIDWHFLHLILLHPLHLFLNLMIFLRRLSDLLYLHFQQQNRNRIFSILNSGNRIVIHFFINCLTATFPR